MIYAQKRLTCLPLCSHISKTTGVTWVHTNKLHYTSKTRSPMYSYHHTTIIFHTMKPRQSSIMSVATVRSQFAAVTLSCPQMHCACYLLACCVLGDVVCQGVCTLPGANVCNIRLHLAVVCATECCFFLSWSSWPGQTHVAAWSLQPQELWKTALFIYHSSYTNKPNKELRAENCMKLKSKSVGPFSHTCTLTASLGLW